MLFTQTSLKAFIQWLLSISILPLSHLTDPEWHTVRGRPKHVTVPRPSALQVIINTDLGEVKGHSMLSIKRTNKPVIQQDTLKFSDTDLSGELLEFICSTMWHLLCVFLLSLHFDTYYGVWV